MRNALIVINKSTPYHALLGRQPAMLPPLEGGYIDHTDTARRLGVQVSEMEGAGLRNLARVREIAASQIIETTAISRLQRADRHKTVAAQERSEYTVGQLVDIWYEPSHKDATGWRGPAQIASLNEGEGNITVRFQGRTLEMTVIPRPPH